MATDKKSVLIYCNWESTFDKLSDEEAGRLFKHLFNYVNDRNPTPPDRITELVFEPIKAVLKEDLKKWDYRVDERSNSGKIGNLKRWNNDLYQLVTTNKISLESALVIASERKVSLKSHSDNSDTVATKNIANVAVNVNDNVNDNDNVNEIDNISPPTTFLKNIIPIEKLEEHMLSQDQWIENFARINKLGSTYEQAIYKAKEFIKLFVEKLKADNEKGWDKNDCFRYCNNFTRIQLKNGTKGQQNASSGFARSGYDPNNGIGTGQEPLSSRKKPKIFQGNSK